MTTGAIFIGCGKIATGAAAILQNQGISTTGVRRNTASLPSALPSVSADVLDPASLTFLGSSQADTIVYSLAASTYNEQSYQDAYITGLRNTINAFNQTQVKRLIFVSSTAVYHQNDGSIVDELSDTTPAKFNGKVMLEAESIARDTGIACVVRLSGIYGHGRLRMIDRVRNGQCTSEDSLSFTNRIHADDCSGILAHLTTLESVPEILIGSDSNPTTATEVETFIADTLKVEKQYNADANNPSRRIAGSKRCNNQRLLSTGYKLIHPDYKSGYTDLIENS